MKDLIVTTRQKAEVSDEQLYALKKEAYQQWADQGLEAEWLQESFEDFQKKIQKALVFVALDPETGELMAAHAFNRRRKGEHKYVFGFYKLMKIQQFGGKQDEQGIPQGTALWHFFLRMGEWSHIEKGKVWRTIRWLMDSRWVGY